MKLWQEETAAVLSAELVLVLSILTVGLVVGLTQVRNVLLSELADVATAIGSLNQSYSVAGVTQLTSRTPGSMFVDQMDTGDPVVVPGHNCVVICTAAAIEQPTVTIWRAGNGR